MIRMVEGSRHDTDDNANRHDKEDRGVRGMIRTSNRYDKDDKG